MTAASAATRAWRRIMSGLFRDLGEERLAVGIAPQEATHHLGLLALVAGPEDGLPVAGGDLRIEQIVAESRAQVAGDHLRPHVPVVARGVATGDVRERRREARALDMAERRLRLELLPYLHRRSRLERELHVERREHPLARIDG